jgi:hypothetical protein
MNLQVDVDAAESINQEGIRESLRQQISDIAAESAELELQQLDNDFSKQSMMRLREIQMKIDRDNMEQLAQLSRETEVAQQMESRRQEVGDETHELLRLQVERQMELDLAKRQQAQILHAQQVDEETMKAQFELSVFEHPQYAENLR